ncbi:MAG: hypothetical protein U0074_02385 [Kouleothrix sp.]
MRCSRRLIGVPGALRARDDAREAEIARQAQAPSAHVNLLHPCRSIEAARQFPGAIIIGDGGGFAGHCRVHRVAGWPAAMA